MDEEPGLSETADAEERMRRWGSLPARVRLEDTFSEQPVNRPPELPNPQDLERVRLATRYGG